MNIGTQTDTQEKINIYTSEVAAAYTVDVEIQGIRPLLQHKFIMAPATKKKTTAGQKDYTKEWLETCFVNREGKIFHPCTHLEGAIVKSGVTRKIEGARGKTFKDMCRSAVYVDPHAIPVLDLNYNEIKLNKKFTVVNQTEGDAVPQEPAYIDERAVTVNRARVVRRRLALNTGWILKFQIRVTDDGLPPEILKDILDHAGTQTGIGDYRPRFGKFIVGEFKVS